MWDRAADEWRSAPICGRINAADNVWIDESPRYLMRWPRVPVVDQIVMRAQVVEMAQEAEWGTVNWSDLPSSLCSVYRSAQA